MLHELLTEAGCASGTQYCAFRLGDLHIGIDVMSVQEVICQAEMTEVPLAPGNVHGLINLRGQIVTVIDLRAQLGLSTEEPLVMNVVVFGDEGSISVLVNEANGVVIPAEDQFAPVPLAVPERVRDLVTGVFKLEGHLLLVLDIGMVMAPQCSSVLPRPE